MLTQTMEIYDPINQTVLTADFREEEFDAMILDTFRQGYGHWTTGRHIFARQAADLKNHGYERPLCFGVSRNRSHYGFIVAEGIPMTPEERAEIERALA